MRVAEPNLPGVIVATLIHDLAGKRSMVALVWDSDPHKRITLSVPYATSLADVRDEAEKALRALAVETASLPVRLAE